MGLIREIEPVKYFVAMLSVDEAGFEQAMKVLSEQYGKFDLISDIIPFSFTNYYRKEMGQNILRRFSAFENLMDPALLPDVKIFTNQLEENLGNSVKGKLKRRVNLDAGYVSMEKLVLASTKNFRHRIYLRNGIYAEVTLYWSKGSFHFYPEHTFPDYRTDFYIRYFNNLMELYRRQLKK